MTPITTLDKLKCAQREKMRRFGWFRPSVGSGCSNRVDPVAGAGDPSAYSNASG